MPLSASHVSALSSTQLCHPPPHLITLPLTRANGWGWMESINTAIFIQLQLCQWLWLEGGGRGRRASTPRVGRILRRVRKTTQFSLSVLVFSSITERGMVRETDFVAWFDTQSSQTESRRFVPIEEDVREAFTIRVSRREPHQRQSSEFGSSFQVRITRW